MVWQLYCASLPKHSLCGDTEPGTLRQELLGGMKLRAYSVKCPKMGLLVWTYEMPNGKLEEHLVFPQN